MAQLDTSRSAWPASGLSCAWMLALGGRGAIPVGHFVEAETPPGMPPLTTRFANPDIAVGSSASGEQPHPAWTDPAV